MRYIQTVNPIYSSYSEVQVEKNFQQALTYMPYIYEDVRSYKSAMQRSDYNKAVEEAEQIGEKSLKAVAKKNGRLSNTLKNKNGHNLKKLASECGIQVQVTKKDLEDLSKAYFKSRYPESGKKYSRKEAEYLGEIAATLMDNAIEELNISQKELDEELGEIKSIESVEDLKVWNRFKI